MTLQYWFLNQYLYLFTNTVMNSCGDQNLVITRCSLSLGWHVQCFWEIRFSLRLCYSYIWCYLLSTKARFGFKRCLYKYFIYQILIWKFWLNSHSILILSTKVFKFINEQFILSKIALNIFLASVENKMFFIILQFVDIER